MPSVSKPQATLMAMAAHNPAFAKKKGIPVGVARDFNQADKRSGILKKAGGGPASMMGHALSGTQLGAADSLIRKAQDRFATFADGGAVKTGPSAKERKEIRSMIERGKSDAVSALRSMRSALIDAQDDQAEEPDAGESLANLKSQLAMKDGGEVDADSADSPEALYDEYETLVRQLHDEQDPSQFSAVVDRLAELEGKLEALGINVESPTGGTSEVTHV